MYTYKIKEIIRVVDGDTVDVLIDLGFGIAKKERVRIAGIDAPETRTKDSKEKSFGIESKTWLTDCLETVKLLTIKTEKEGKYGRILGWLYIDDSDASVNEIMINEGYAWEYNRDKKEKDFDLLLSKRAIRL
tara:strand:- start:565 stop:960 length:396 start_codon:yes stop_codon:yes gene_type:complete